MKKLDRKAVREAARRAADEARAATGSTREPREVLKATLLILFCIASLFIIGGCKTEQPQDTNAGDPDYFISELTETNWQGTVSGEQVTIHLDADDEGYCELEDGTKIPFKYAVSDVNSDNTEGKFDITISDDQYESYQSLIKGQITAELTSDKDLKLTLNGVSTTLSPAESNFQ